MNLQRVFIIFFSLFVFSIVNTYQSNAGFDIPIPDSDSNNDDENYGMTAFFDLRDRESFVQVTNNDSEAIILHIQIYNVAQNCNENNFFDNYTINDTHVYNLRDILTNDGNPSGVVLPEDAYGIVVVTPVNSTLDSFEETSFIGNFRIIDDNGYEYRTNMSGWNDDSFFPDFIDDSDFLTFNFSQQGGVSFSDIVGILVVDPGNSGEWQADNVTRTFAVMDVDIYDLNEVPLSCRDIAFSCVQPDSSFVDEILAFDGDGGDFEGSNGATAASFEYGINNVIPHSKNGELLCPGNVIQDGIVVLNFQGMALPSDSDGEAIFNVFVGLNNGNGRGSMDAVWWENPLTTDDP